MNRNVSYFNSNKLCFVHQFLFLLEKHWFGTLYQIVTIFQEPLSELVCHDRWNNSVRVKYENYHNIEKYSTQSQSWLRSSVFTIHRIGKCSWRDEWRAKAIISHKNSGQIIIPVKVFKLLLKFTSCQNIGVSFSVNGNIMFIPTQAVRDLMTKNRRRVILTTW